MDGLTDEERIIAWQAAWHYSFDGWAIVNPDFTFRSVNNQFCDILKITPAEVIGKKFQDVTSAPLREIDETNARMVQQGLIDHYALEKDYEFQSGKKTRVVLLVTRVPKSEEGSFLFYLSRILPEKPKNLPSQSTHQKATDSFMDFIIKNYKPLIAIGISVGGAIAMIIDKLF